MTYSAAFDSLGQVVAGIAFVIATVACWNLFRSLI